MAEGRRVLPETAGPSFRKGIQHFFVLTRPLGRFLYIPQFCE
jgi:hypothetical protein